VIFIQNAVLMMVMLLCNWCRETRGIFISNWYGTPRMLEVPSRVEKVLWALVIWIIRMTASSRLA
jgi:hypothetical protein